MSPTYTVEQPYSDLYREDGRSRWRIREVDGVNFTVNLGVVNVDESLALRLDADGRDRDGLYWHEEEAAKRAVGVLSGEAEPEVDALSDILRRLRQFVADLDQGEPHAPGRFIAMEVRRRFPEIS